MVQGPDAAWRRGRASDTGVGLVLHFPLPVREEGQGSGWPYPRFTQLWVTARSSLQSPTWRPPPSSSDTSKTQPKLPAPDRLQSLRRPTSGKAALESPPSPALSPLASPLGRWRVSQLYGPFAGTRARRPRAGEGATAGRRVAGSLRQLRPQLWR